MGLTPLEGLVMGTRSGDIDPALPFFLHRETGVPFEKVESLLNKQSGLLGVSGLSNDCRSLWEAADQGHARARLALEIFAYRVRKYIGAYMAVLNGLDAIVFTGGIGERDVLIRQMVCSGLDWFGIQLDEKKNLDTFGKEGVISAPESRVRLMVLPTNEELEIANETLPFVRKAPPAP
jgi:acetate kinase